MTIASLNIPGDLWNDWVMILSYIKNKRCNSKLIGVH